MSQQLFPAETIKRVQESWKLVGDDRAAAGALFYSKLFGANPTFPSTMFKGVDMAKQGGRVIGMIDSAVKLLEKPEDLLKLLNTSGARHVLYGTQDAHYPVVGAALLETLQAALGEAFTPEVKEAWVTVYGAMSSVMIAAQHSEAGQKYQEKARLHRVHRLVEASWRAVGTDFDAAGAMFYKNLFALAPSLQGTLFKSVDMKVQGPKLFKMVDSAVKLLGKPGELVPVLKASGARHIKYGAVEAHYPVVGEALLATLREVTGDAFDDETRAAWVEVYGTIQGAMLEGAREATASP